ncbi:succinylglutamate desuccinylase/aspartoacylase family protein [Gloeocapsopsis crepidinum LEGE 06123]|uniref:Succinylglutamate desuccinylase/aspartoacylase family protein n=1 Tax=Gloeocapsopsis crepidinum LEGE 06123 TaxID=588587 RepID=A0ABR9UQC0_9CHRO|nr:succinylglutamate desuccinylase/aspartoacylase family protein [Gloeocapsopsis crepidinum]MBE9190250.1 succinylglutamate desuccinylase/aspartoacylase family protein [Gloeocapsopsis crepidinum LEGE 06123]
MIPNIYTIPLIQLASGDRLSLQVYRFVGAKSGKKVYLQANLHGAEIAGNAVIYQLIEFLKTLQVTQLVGEVWLVPVCNPLGVNQRSHRFASGRYCVYEGKDWNRIFWDYEKSQDDLEEFAKTQINLDIDTIRINYSNKIINHFATLTEKIHSPSSVPFTELFRYRLQSLSIDADYVIDLHTSTDRGLDYLYYFSSRELSAQYFLLDYGILLDDYDGDAFDEAFIKPWLALENTLRQLGREITFDIEAWTLELGSGMQMTPQSVEKGVQGVKNYLLHKGVLALKTKAIAHEMTFRSKSQVTKYYAPVGGMVQARVPLGSEVEAGEKLYEILMFNKTGELPSLIDICAEKDGLVYDVATNHAVNEGEYVLAVM